MTILQVCSHISAHTHLHTDSITALLFNYLASIVQRLPTLTKLYSTLGRKTNFYQGIALDHCAYNLSQNCFVSVKGKMWLWQAMVTL